ncbi:MAG: methyltransferase domain-containing protein [Actinomycetota bacterium]
MSTDQDYSQAVEVAREYYNSDDADNFYSIIWGGEDIHVGMYRSDEEPIFDASRRTVAHMAGRVKSYLGPDARVLDIGAGYGGAARYLAKTYGCRVAALNLSEVENERDRKMNAEQGVDHLIEVVDASFEEVPYPDASFDVVWSQDAILHSGDRPKVLQEVLRLMRSGGRFVFTDPMAADDCPPGVLSPILERIHLDSLGSPGWYIDTLQELGLIDEGYEDHAHQLTNHYSRVLRELESREDELQGRVSAQYVERMKKGLRHWIEGGRNGYLAWGVFLFSKPGS